ncbi:MAG: sensor histidine kinase [Pseudomonadota bacterium]
MTDTPVLDSDARRMRPESDRMGHRPPSDDDIKSAKNVTAEQARSSVSSDHGAPNPIADTETAVSFRPKLARRIKKRSIPRRMFHVVSRFFARYVFSTLSQRIIFLNMAALIVLLAGIIFLNQFRDGLIEAREESLLIQGEIISAAIAARATVETDAINIDPDRLLELKAGESAVPMESETESLDFPINPEQVAPILRRLISPTRTRARIYDQDGLIILDSDRLYSRGQILRYDLPSVTGKEETTLEDIWLRFRRWFWQGDLQLYRESADGNGTAYSEVVTALTGSPGTKTRRTENGDTIVSVAVPVQRFRAVLGVLLLSTEAGDIDAILEKERLAIMRVFGVATLVTLLLSILLASTIAKPLHRLSAAAQRVRLGVKSRETIPDFSDRHDEIGKLSTSMRQMTDSLYARLDAIERFAADVSHELKNPLTSLRSAVETLPLAKREDQKARLHEVIQHDVRRLDRLISDISNASRLDAELARDDNSPVDLEALLISFADTYQGMAANETKKPFVFNLTIDKDTQAVTSGRRRAVTTSQAPSWMVMGHDGRLGQVMANLIENARTFLPPKGGEIDVHMWREANHAVVTVRDNGPGIPAENTERIFERFYTDRPKNDGFGQNSGLGLSITQQIIEAHHGTIKAGNRPVSDGTGAVFTVRLPLHTGKLASAALPPKAAN